MCLVDCDAWCRVWYFLLPAGAGQERFDSAPHVLYVYNSNIVLRKVFAYNKRDRRWAGNKENNVACIDGMITYQAGKRCLVWSFLSQFRQSAALIFRVIQFIKRNSFLNRKPLSERRGCNVG